MSTLTISAMKHGKPVLESITVVEAMVELCQGNEVAAFDGEDFVAYLKFNSQSELSFNLHGHEHIFMEGCRAPC